MNVIFVCTGNTCRSPMAEGIARKLAAERGIEGINFSSAGTSAFEGAAASDSSLLVALERGIDIASHRARVLTDRLVEDDTIFLALASSHLVVLQSAFPKARAYLLSDYASRGVNKRSVSDPFGGDLIAYREAANEIEEMISAALDRLATERTSQQR